MQPGGSRLVSFRIKACTVVGWVLQIRYENPLISL
jgi:hypothetical protein